MIPNRCVLNKIGQILPAASNFGRVWSRRMSEKFVFEKPDKFLPAASNFGRVSSRRTSPTNAPSSFGHVENPNRCIFTILLTFLTMFVPLAKINVQTMHFYIFCFFALISFSHTRISHKRSTPHTARTPDNLSAQHALGRTGPSLQRLRAKRRNRIADAQEETNG